MEVPNSTFAQRLATLVRARFTLIVVATVEEERAMEIIAELCSRTQRPCLSWDVAEGFRAVTPMRDSLPAARDPLTALDHVERLDGNALVVLPDFHDCWTAPPARRKLRAVAQRLKYTSRSLIVLAPSGRIPEELRDVAVVLDMPLPDATDVEEVLGALLGSPGVRSALTPLGREKLVQAALGMTVAQARRAFCQVVAAEGTLDDRAIDLVTADKQQIVRESEALEFFPVAGSADDVGGNGVLKLWLAARERAFGREAREYRLPVPRGVALIGIPGTGKSLTARMIGGLWRLPLLRLDTGALFGSLLGESEERARRALRVAEALAPCVLWIDEMEKAFATGGLDGGTGNRVFATILTWMQEKAKPCFVVATANDIGRLPPELLRKGRFDEIFFLDLPTLEERMEILAVHLRKRGRAVGAFDVARLAARAEGFVGAEIEQAIVEAMYVAFSEDREFTTQDIGAAFERQVPLSVSQRESVDELRSWLREGRARSASFEEAREAEQRCVRIEVLPGGRTDRR